jgi:hypothetical protein
VQVDSSTVLLDRFGDIGVTVRVGLNGCGISSVGSRLNASGFGCD